MVTTKNENDITNDITHAFKDVMHTIEQYAPTIGAALATPQLGFAMAALAHVFEGDCKDHHDLVKRIMCDDLHMDKLLEIEKKYGPVIKILLGK